MENNLQNQHAHVADRIPDPVDIILDAAHQLYGIGSVKIVRAQRLDMGKEILSHICGDERADPVEGKFFGIAEYASACAHQKDASQQIFQPA